jgi:hypothetical protein
MSQVDVVCVVECPEGFNDFSIIKASVKPGEQVEVSESQFGQMKQSSPGVVLVEKRIPLDSEAGKRMQAEAAEKEEEKAAIRKKYEKDAPPRRKKKTKGSERIPNPEKKVSPAELVNLPVTKDEKDE